jgi:hypothetical protein
VTPTDRKAAIVQLEIDEEALARLKEVFVSVEGSCEAWADDEVVRRVLIRGAMEYAKSGGAAWEDVQALAAELRRGV